MAYATQYRDQATGLPSIRIPSTDRLRGQESHQAIPFGRSPAMSIPGIGIPNDAPPPLPPPRFLPGSEFSQPTEFKERKTFGQAAPPSFSSGYGSMASSAYEERPNYQRRDLCDRDEGYESYPSGRSRESLPSLTEFGRLHNHFQFQSPADIHGDSMKKKLDQTVRACDKSPPRSLLSASFSEPRRCSIESRFPPVPSLSAQIPIHTRSFLESPARMTETPLHSAVSPRSGFAFEQRSPNDSSDIDRSPKTRSRRNNSDDATSTQGSTCDYNGAEDMEIEETQGIKRLHIDDAYVGGQKRRAASPQDDHLLPGQPDVFHRHEGPRGSPLRLDTIPQGFPAHSSRSNSYISTMSVPPSTISTTSYGRRSPGGMSPTSGNSPYSTPISLNPSPRTSISGRSAIHTRNISGNSPRKIPEVQKSAGSKLQNFFMCECCPKKPKKFETREELNAHEAEKQYECSFCGNRFKNKNEAERHQNSLHVRRHSWSCSALAGYDRAFHESTSRPGEADTCGYCGDEFQRSGRGPGANAPRHATDPDWDERIRHLQDVHKFRECNSAKKFYRADHFRQHLKHSHAGSSGKWTNMLENACMMDEDPTPR